MSSLGTRSADPVTVGMMLPPDAATLALLLRILETECQHFAVSPETLWRLDAHGHLIPNGFHREFAELQQRTGRAMVAHGVGLSMGTLWEQDLARQARWLARIREDHSLFHFEWYTEHLGVTSLAGEALTLPLAVSMTPVMAEVIRARLDSLADIVPLVGLENTAAHYLLGTPLEEPVFLRQLLAGPGRCLLLDLHNLYTMSLNLGFEADDYLARLPLDRVIEIHLSGGSWSEPRWSPSGRILRMDSHDGPVPEEVWGMLERILPRCPSLRAITLERRETTVTPADVPLLSTELARARGLAAAITSQRKLQPASPEIFAWSVAEPDMTLSASVGLPPTREELLALEQYLPTLVCRDHPMDALRNAREDLRLPASVRSLLKLVDADGWHISCLLVARLRFERLLRGSAEAAAWFEQDPEGFSLAFKAYHMAVPLHAFFPQQEATLFSVWLEEPITEQEAMGYGRDLRGASGQTNG